MKTNEEIKKILVNNLRAYLREFTLNIEEMITIIEKAETVEEVMKYKRRLLFNWVYYIPLGSSVCYFCIMNLKLGESSDNFFDRCPNCLYAKHHGNCTGNRESDYRDIVVKRDALICAISEYYREGETYDDNSLSTT